MVDDGSWVFHHQKRVVWHGIDQRVHKKHKIQNQLKNNNEIVTDVLKHALRCSGCFITLKS